MLPKMKVHIERTQAIAEGAGADLVGVADLGRVRRIYTSPGNLLSKFRYAVSAAVDLEKFGRYDTSTEDDLAFPQLRAVAKEIKRYIESEGYSAKIIAPDKRVSRSGPLYLRGEISHKAVARTAGLGWIGKSALLVTPALGPKVCLVTILTDMPLPAGRPMRNRCGHCQRCVAACPVKALKGASFEDRPRRIGDAIDVWKCNAWVNKTWRRGELCFACVVACPKGSARKRHRRDRKEK